MPTRPSLANSSNVALSPGGRVSSVLKERCMRFKTTHWFYVQFIHLLEVVGMGNSVGFQFVGIR